MAGHSISRGYNGVKRHVKLRWFDRHFLDHQVIVDNPNNIHAFNKFEEKGHAERKYNLFRLTDLTREELYVMGVPAILDDVEKYNFFVSGDRYKIFL